MKGAQFFLIGATVYDARSRTASEARKIWWWYFGLAILFIILGE